MVSLGAHGAEAPPKLSAYELPSLFLPAICATLYLALYKAPATECAPLPFKTALLSSVRGVYRATVVVAYIQVTPEAEGKAWRTRQMLPDVPVGRLQAALRARW